MTTIQAAPLIVPTGNPFAKDQATEQLGSPSSTVYTDENTDFSDTTSSLGISRQSSEANTQVKKLSFNTQNVFDMVLGSETQQEGEENVKKTLFHETPSRKSTSDETVMEDEQEDVEDEEEEEETAEEIKDWNERKEKLLRSLATKCKYDWKKITKKFNSSEKTDIAPSALKTKYKGMINTSIPLRVKFSHQEDLMIAKYFELYGCDWTQIATHFTDRNAMMLKNRYYSHIRKRNLLDVMLKEVRGDEGEEEQPVKADEDINMDKSTDETSESADQEVEIKPEPIVNIVENKVEKAVESEPSFIDNYFFFGRSSFNNIGFDMEDLLRSELSVKITRSYY